MRLSSFNAAIFNFSLFKVSSVAGSFCKPDSPRLLQFAALPGLCLPPSSTCFYSLLIHFHTSLFWLLHTNLQPSSLTSLLPDSVFSLLFSSVDVAFVSAASYTWKTTVRCVRTPYWSTVLLGCSAEAGFCVWHCQPSLISWHCHALKRNCSWTWAYICVWGCGQYF